MHEAYELNSRAQAAYRLLMQREVQFQIARQMCTY